MKMTTLALAFVLSYITCVHAADTQQAEETPKSPAALAAIRDRDQAVKTADDLCRNAKIAAERKLIDKLKISMAAATKAGNLTEANAIDAQIKKSLADIEELKTSASKTSSVTYVLWRLRWNDGSNKYWLMPDGTAINGGGMHGTWKRDGTTYSFDWGNERDVFTVKGSAVTGTNVGNNRPLTGDVVGTNLTGVEAPPGN